MRYTIYLDHNATTPVHPELKTKIPEWLENWGNPSSIHWAGRGPKGLLREARQNLAALVGVEPLQLIFTSGGSEANNLALQGMCDSARLLLRDHIIVSALEHPSVRATAEFLRTRGFRLDVIPANRAGQLDMQYLDSVLSPQTALVSVMLANNETGNILPVREIARRAHQVGALMHCDAVQGLGKIPLNLPALEVDLATVSGHKFYALKGCGALYVRQGLNLNSLIHGGGQERGRRAGTENILSLASLGFMATKSAEIVVRSGEVAFLRDHLERRILSEISDVSVTGAAGERLSNTSSLVLSGVDGETLLMNLDVRGCAVSTGAACSAGSPEPSPTLLAMGLSRGEAQSSLRLSLGWETTRVEVDEFVDILVACVARLRSFKHGEHARYV